MYTLSQIFTLIKFYCTYVYWFIMHCAHPPVDAWRVFIHNFKWEPYLHQLYIDARNHGRYNPDVDFASVVGCSTGVGFEVAAGLASVGLTVFAGVRRAENRPEDRTRVARVVEQLKERSKEIFIKHHIDQGDENQKKIIAEKFEPKIIGIEVDVSDFDSCRAFTKEVAKLMGINGKQEEQGEAPSPSQQKQRRGRSSSSASKTQKPRASSSSASPAKRGRRSSAAATSPETLKQQQPLLRICLLNAAILMSPYRLTPQGFEAQTATNALGHMIIAEHLIANGCFDNNNNIQDNNNRESRLIFVSSSGARFGDPLRGTFANINNHDEHDNKRLLPTTHCQFKMYGDSKALVLAYAKLLQDRLLLADNKNNNNKHNKLQNLSIRVLHPGCIASQIVKDSGMPGRHGLAAAQKKIGIPIGAMVDEERASTYTIRLCLGVDGKQKHDADRERRELFSYLFAFETKMMRHIVADEKMLVKVRDAVQYALGSFMPKKKSLIA